MTGARQLPERDYLALKAATRALVKTCGGQQAAAGVTRVGHQALSRYGGTEGVEFAPIDVIADLEAEIGAPVVTRELADLAGYDLVKRGEGDGLSLLRRLPLIARETSDVVNALAAALADGEVSAAEREELRRETRQALAELYALQSSLEHAEAAR